MMPNWEWTVLNILQCIFKIFWACVDELIRKLTTHTKASLPVIYYCVARESFLHHWKTIKLAWRVSPQCGELSDFTERWRSKQAWAVARCVSCVSQLSQWHDINIVLIAATVRWEYCTLRSINKHLSLI